MTDRRAPNELRGPIADAVLRSGLAAWLRVEKDGVVLEGGGDLARFGLEGSRTPDFLHGLDPEDHSLPAVEVSPGRLADLYLTASGPNILVLLLDANPRVERERELLAAANALALWHERQAASTGAHTGELLESLGVALLQRGPDARLSVAGKAPSWLADLIGLDPQNPFAVDEVDDTGFLGNFLFDAEDLWSGAEAGSLRSGAWMEPTTNAETYFEAVAVLDAAGQGWVAVELLDDLYEERRTILQQGRETQLDFDRLRREIAKKEVLLHTIVHDLKAPLASIVGVLSLLNQASLPPEKRAQLLAAALRQAHGQDERICRLLEVFARDLAELESAEPDPKFAPELNAVAREVVERCRMAFAGLTLELHTHPAALKVAGRTERLERVVENLVLNARRHARSRVEVLVESDGDGATLTVHDDGPGVDPTVIERLFEPMVHGPEGGTGLGLYSCKLTLTPWGGSIEHVPGEGGATFRIHLRPAPS